MKIILTTIIIVATFTSCNKSFSTQPQSEPQEVIVAHANTYQYMGTVSLYFTADSAYQNRTFGRPYYRDIPVLDKDLILYQNAVNSQKVNGSGKWVCVTSTNGNSWTAIQLSDKGVILATKDF